MMAVSSSADAFALPSALPGPAFPVYETAQALTAACDAGLASATERVAALEKMVATFEREIHRLDGIRKRTDTSLLETRALLARLQDNAVRADDR